MYHKLKKGFLADSAKQYQEEINLRNFNSLQAFSFVGTIVSLAILVFGLLLRDVVTFNVEFSVLAAYFMLLYLASRFLLNQHRHHVTLLFYIVITPPMIAAILMGTFLDPYEPSITIMVFMCGLPLFILDRPWRVCLYISAVALVFGVCCYLAKDLTLFVEDFIDLAAFYFLAIGVNIFTLIDRLENVENFIKYREKSETDPLTGLYNRGIGKDKVVRLLEQQTYGTFCMIDIDHFKQINDTYGHDQGDALLREVADVIRRAFASQHVYFRMGGDEFIVFCVKVIEENASHKIMDAFSKQIQQIHVVGIPQHITVSIGCCIYHQGTTSYDALLKLGDQALYKAKRNGRNQSYIESMEG